MAEENGVLSWTVIIKATALEEEILFARVGLICFECGWGYYM
jgi:hypothetical protein